MSGLAWFGTGMLVVVLLEIWWLSRIARKHIRRKAAKLREARMIQEAHGISDAEDVRKAMAAVSDILGKIEHRKQRRRLDEFEGEPQ